MRSVPEKLNEVKPRPLRPAISWLSDLASPIRSARTRLAVRTVANIVGAVGAALFVRAQWDHYSSTHSWVGAGFLVNEMWVVVAYLIRRPARIVSPHVRDWLFAFGGTFGGVLFRPNGAHIHVAVVIGANLQIIGLLVCGASFLSLGRSFGFAAADRGLKQRGTYRVVRHPIYASYILLLGGYLLQSLSLANAAVMILVLSCDVGRALREERLLISSANYADYRSKVRWRMVPAIW